jgi:hypothetical protein
VNRMEDRLRDAFGAAAETVRPEAITGPPDRPVARTRHVGPLAAAAAVAAVVIGASVITPLVLAGGPRAPSPPGQSRVSSPAASASPSGAVLVVPKVYGTPVSQALAALHAAGLRVSVLSAAGGPVPVGTVIAQNPGPGTQVATSAVVEILINSGSSPSVTFTLAPSRLVTVSAYAVTIRIPQSWRRTPGLGSAVGYNGTSGWVQVQAVTEPADLKTACRDVAAQNVSQYGRHPYISDRSIDGRPGCLIVADLVVLRDRLAGGLPMTSALVEYRSPLRDGANFLLMSGDPASMTGVDTIRLHH